MICMVCNPIYVQLKKVILSFLYAHLHTPHLHSFALPIETCIDAVLDRKSNPALGFTKGNMSRYQLTFLLISVVAPCFSLGIFSIAGQSPCLGKEGLEIPSNTCTVQCVYINIYNESQKSHGFAW